MTSSCLGVSARDECAGRASRHTLCPHAPMHTLRSLTGTTAFLTQPQVASTSGVLNSSLRGPFSLWAPGLLQLQASNQAAPLAWNALPSPWRTLMHPRLPVWTHHPPLVPSLPHG